MRSSLLALVLTSACAAAQAGGEASRTATSSKATAVPNPYRFVEPPVSTHAVVTSAGTIELGILPNEFSLICRQHFGRATQFVAGNRLSVICSVPFSDLPSVTVGFCPDGESTRACYVLQASDEVPSHKAALLVEQLTQQLTATHGVARAGSQGSMNWSWIDKGLIHLSLVPTATGMRVALLHGSTEGANAFSNYPSEFPPEVAGFAFRATIVDASHNCTAKRGTFLETAPTHPAPAQTITRSFVCADPQVESPRGLRTVTGLLCNGQVCELALELGGSLEAALKKIEDEYGPTTPSSEPGECKAQSRHYRWVWAARNQTEGVLRLTDDCGLKLFYDDAQGFALRQSQPQRRLQSF